MLITTNQMGSQWVQVFGDDVLAAAILDRLLHQSHSVLINRDSYRLKQKRKAGLLRSATTNQPTPEGGQFCCRNGVRNPCRLTQPTVFPRQTRCQHFSMVTLGTISAGSRPPGEWPRRPAPPTCGSAVGQPGKSRPLNRRAALGGRTLINEPPLGDQERGLSPNLPHRAGHAGAPRQRVERSPSSR